MIFSDNVPLDQEVALKRTATERGLLVMGPDCGTAVVGGLGLGFANAVSPGPVGIVAASGTGCQQLLALLDHAGVGVASALGVGGRDLSAEVRGLSTREALRRLDADPAVELIVVVSKPPAAEVAAEIREYAAGLGTPVEFALLGRGQPDLTAGRRGGAAPARPRRTGLAGLRQGAPPRAGGTAAARALRRRHPVRRGDADRLRGARPGPQQHPALPRARRSDPDLVARRGHTMVDFGDDALTAGRAHPMIDPTLRLEHLARAAADPDTGVLLLDVVLGHGAEPDPAAAARPGDRGGLPARRGRGRRHRRRPAGPRPPGRRAGRRRRRGPPVQRRRHPPRDRAARPTPARTTDDDSHPGRRPPAPTCSPTPSPPRPSTSPASTGARRCPAPRPTSPPCAPTRCAATPTQRALAAMLGVTAPARRRGARVRAARARARPVPARRPADRRGTAPPARSAAR